MYKRLIPSQTALVLGGGGAKGAYQIGVARALDALGVGYAHAYGTSIGALNAAMLAQGNPDAAAGLWATIRLSDVVTPESIALAEEAELVFSRPDRMLDFITRNAQKKGLDATPLFSVMRAAVDEQKLRSSGISFGLVTTRFPSLSMTEKRLEDMAPGSLCDWLEASAACFPALPMKQIAGERYLDGGFSDNVPVEMAIRAGAKHIIAVDIGRTQAHTHYALRPNITYIRASQPLGGLLTFDPERSQRNMALGYNDAMRAFGRLRGTHYSFDPIDAQLLSGRTQDFVCFLTAYEAEMSGRKNDAPLFSLLEEEMRPGSDAIEYFLRALELCAQTLEIDPAKVYTFEALRDAIRAALPLEQAQAMLGSLLGGRIGVLFAPPQPDRKIVLACLHLILRHEGRFSSLAMHTLAAFPRELLCALTLREIL
ncbi:MAG: patatin-like phospholipase family protein [Clostridiales bacterium]|nr:patatin-like phospholipase family protein [Clostridiales bacterium]